MQNAETLRSLILGGKICYICYLALDHLPPSFKNYVAVVLSHILLFMPLTKRRDFFPFFFFFVCVGVGGGLRQNLIVYSPG
jgi:hypothetical protein